MKQEKISGLDEEQTKLYHLLMSRQSDIVQNTASKRVLIIGVGGLGSNAADLFASMGVLDITLLDFDTVAPENMFPGHFPGAAMGIHKVTAVREQLQKDYPLVSITEINADIMELDEGSLEEQWDIIFVGTDALESRRHAWNNLASKCNWWLDGRMGGTGCCIFVIPIEDEASAKNYEDHEFAPIVTPQPCGSKSTSGITTGYFRGMLWEVFMNICDEDKPPYGIVLSDGLDLVRVNLKESDDEEESKEGEEKEG